VYDNYPNPFNPSTNIKFDIPKPGYIIVNIYDITGKLIMTTYSCYTDKLAHNFQVDMKNFTSGIYIYTVEYNNQRISIKMILLK